MEKILTIKKNNGFIYLIVATLLLGMAIFSGYLTVSRIITNNLPFYYVLMLIAFLLSSILFLKAGLQIVTLKNPVVIINGNNIILYPNNPEKQLIMSVDIIKVQLEKNNLTLFIADKSFSFNNAINAKEVYDAIIGIQINGNL